MELKIYSQDGTLKMTVSPSDSSTHVHELMGENVVNASFTSPEYVSLDVNDYLELEGKTYKLHTAYEPRQKSMQEYTYNVKFYGRESDVKRALMLYLTDGELEPKFSYEGSPRDHVQKVVDSLNYMEGGNRWVAGTVIDAPNLSLDYNNVFCDQALTELAGKLETEWWIEGYTVNLCRCEFGEAVELGYLHGLTNLQRSDNNTDVRFFTRLIPLGSTKNIDKGLYGFKRLQLPGREKYVDKDVDRYGIYPQVEESAFEGIFPHRTGTLSEVRSEERTGENGKYVVWYFKDSGLDFDPNEYDLPGLVKHVIFKSGDLQERDFEINFDSGKKEFEIITQYPDEESQLPGGNLIPASGDTYILYNLRMPDEYYAPAEAEYKAAVDAFLAKYSTDTSIYRGDTDYVHILEHGITLSVGRRVRLLSDNYFKETGHRNSRITKVTRKLNNLSQATIECTNAVGKGRMEVIESDVDSIRKTLTERLDDTTWNILRSWDSGDITDYKVFSALRALREIKKRALSRTEEDFAERIIHFLEGLTADKLVTCNNGLLVKSPVATRRLSAALTEDYSDPDIMSPSLIEDNDKPDVISLSLTEESASGEFGGTLGELDNVDDSFDTLPNGKYVIDVREGVAYPIKASSVTGGGSSLALKYVSSSSLVALFGDKIPLRYSFESIDMADNTPTGSGTAIYKVNGGKVDTQIVDQGTVEWDCGKYLLAGDNTVIITLTDAYGKTRSLTYAVTAVSLSVSSNFNAFTTYSDSISFRYIPIGSVSKNVIFKMDGNVIFTVTTEVTNRQLIQTIPAQTHGEHILEVYLEADIEGTTVRSNTLRYALACIVPGNNTPIIASAFHVTESPQYQTLNVPYLVYNPAASTANVSLFANGLKLSDLTVERTRQVWNYRPDDAGKLTLKIACGGVSKSFGLTVTESTVDVSAESENLELYLTAAGRNNSETNPATWSNNGISSSLTGFNFVTNGWIANDQGSVALKLSGEARVRIPLKIFGKDFRSTGKTIEFEFETMDVVDYEAIVVDCMNNGRGIRITAQKALFQSEQTLVETRFKENERIRVSFVVEDRTQNRLIYTYINGKISGVAQYPVDDSFTQAIPADILIGSENCTLCLYNIRVYDNALNDMQMLGNYNADLDDIKRKLTIYERNRIFDSSGNIVYSYILNQLPCMTIIGQLPTFKGDKKTVSLVYENRQQPDKSFMADGVQIDVQGTSSQYYPRKNYKTKFKNGLILTESEEHLDGYKLRADSIAVNAFCQKADFAESSGTHNTGMAKIIDRLLKGMGFLTPPQKNDKRVRTTVDGFPICIFHKETPDSPPEFVGKYNFNNDKSTQDTFGFTGVNECWEFCNNTSDRVLFLSSDYTSLDAEGNPDWLNDFEARYPDGFTDYTNLKVLTDWIVSTKNNPEKFRKECTAHFDRDSLLAYYLMTELFGMVDQRAKNMFLATWDSVKWYPIFYDNDTVCGINNEGAVVFGYDIEYHDTLGSGNVWNGERSVLWNNVEQAYPEEIAAMYQRMRSEDLISYDTVIGVLNGEQSEKWCESIYNADSKYKYIDPLIEEGNGSYLYAAQGSREEHRKWWLYNRFKYIDSKYIAGDYKNDYVTMRLYTPVQWDGVAPDANFTIVPYLDEYVRVKYGSYLTGKRGYKDVPVTIQAPAIQFNDTETIVYGASGIKSLGDLSGKYPGTVDISKATKLVELVAGSAEEGYSNTNLTVLSIGNNKLFRKLDIRNCPMLTQPVDVSGCENIEEIYAEGTSVTAVSLPAAGLLRELHLPETITNLIVRNQPKLTNDGLSLAGVSKLSAVWVEGTPGVDTLSIVSLCLSEKTVALNRVRMINVDWYAANLEIMAKLAKMRGMDANGIHTDKAVVTGKCHVFMATTEKLAAVRTAFPELAVTYDQLKPETVTTFVFRSSGSKSITNASFECNFPYVKVSETTYKITAEDNETISFTFKCENHADYSNTYLVSGTRTQNFSVVYIPLRTIRVKVYGQSVYPSRAQVKINGKTLTSDSNGYVYYRGGEAISGEVSAIGYSGNTFSFSATTYDQSYTIEVYPAVEVKFIVKDEYGSLLPNAIVSCDNETAVTNLYGECVLLLGRGTYNYVVTYSDYLTKIGSTTVGTSASTVNISLDPAKVDVKFIVKDKSNALLEGVTVQCAGKSAITDNKGECIIAVDSKQTYEFSCTKYGYFDYTGNYTVTIYNIATSVSMIFNAEIFKPEENGNIQMLLNGGTATININSTSRNYNIIWGDGNIDSAAGTGAKTYTHNYGNVDNYQVEIRNCENITSCNGSSSCLIAYWSIGNSKVTNLSFRSFSRLCYVGQVFKNDTIRTSFYECFYRCEALPNLPLGLFDDCINVISFERCFCDCFILMSIPSNLFAKCSKVNSFASTFSGCANLMNIPELLFDKNSEVTTFSYCFGGCKSIKTIPANLFGKCMNTITFSSCFQDCTSLVDIPEGLFSKCTAVTDFSYCFRGCSRLITISPGLFLNCLKVSTFSGCFIECNSIKTIPVGLFDNCPNVTRFWGLFWACRELEHIPEGLFDNCPNVESFSYCFNGCSKLDNIPSKLFKNCPNVSTFEWCFINCSSASHLPTLWVQYYGKDIIKKECFKGCTEADNWSDVPVSWGGTAEEYIPPVTLSGPALADYNAFNARLMNIENQLNINKN